MTVGFKINKTPLNQYIGQVEKSLTVFTLIHNGKLISIYL